jgi:hypothetical protein
MGSCATKVALTPLELHGEKEEYPVDSGPAKCSFLCKIFWIKPFSKKIHITLPEAVLRAEFLGIFHRCPWAWRISEAIHTQIVPAKLSSHNSAGLKPMLFRLEVIPARLDRSTAIFTQEKEFP